MPKQPQADKARSPRPPRSGAARASRSRRASRQASKRHAQRAAIEHARSQSEADAWNHSPAPHPLSRAAGHLDHAAIGYCRERLGDAYDQVCAHVDWQDSRETRWRAEQHQDDPASAVASVAYRRARISRILRGKCSTCEHPPSEWMFAGEILRQGRHGAVDPADRCAGCQFADYGELEPDRSMASAMDPRAWGRGGRRCDA